MFMLSPQLSCHQGGLWVVEVLASCFSEPTAFSTGKDTCDTQTTASAGQPPIKIMLLFTLCGFRKYPHPSHGGLWFACLHPFGNSNLAPYFKISNDERF